MTDASKILRGRDIVCFPHDWTGDPLSKTHIMRILARDNRVLWVNSIGLRAPSVSKADFKRSFNKLAAAAAPIKEVEPNLFVMNPLTMPAYGQPILRAINQRSLRFQIRRAMRKLNFKNPVNYVFLPSAALLAGKLGEDLIIYHCVDEYAAFSDIATDTIAKLEEELLKKSDLIIVSADLLYQSKVKHNPRTVIVRHGVDYAHFSKAIDPNTKIPDEIANLPKPVIGFFGLVEDWVDVRLMAKVAEHFSQGSLVVLGKVKTDISALEKLPNAHILGRKPYSELPAYCKGFDVALNPFVINELTLNANPLKVREYLATGLPVVSTAIPEVEILGQCRIGRDDESFINEIAEALEETRTRQERSEAIKSESWEARVDEIRKHIASLSSAE
jgi:glycosyltransferase involved in cell wall biosynthesis